MVSDNFGLTSNVATVTVQVAASPPIANNERRHSGRTPIAINVLANDSDPNAGGILNPASVVIVGGTFTGRRRSIR